MAIDVDEVSADGTKMWWSYECRCGCGLPAFYFGTIEGVIHSVSMRVKTGEKTPPIALATRDEGRDCTSSNAIDYNDSRQWPYWTIEH